MGAVGMLACFQVTLAKKCRDTWSDVGKRPRGKTCGYTHILDVEREVYVPVQLDKYGNHIDHEVAPQPPAPQVWMKPYYQAAPVAKGEKPYVGREVKLADFQRKPAHY